MKMNKKQIKYFVEKFESKMSGSILSSAIFWIDGIGEISAAEKTAILLGVMNAGAVDLSAGLWDHEERELPAWSLDATQNIGLEN